MSTENVKSPNKKSSVITYIIALLVIIGAWFIPLFGSFASFGIDGMAFWYLPAMINSALGFNLLPASITSGHPLPEFVATSVDLFGISLNLSSILYVAYAVVTVLAVIMLIPVLAGNKNKRTSGVCAYIVEILAIFVIATILISSAFNAAPGVTIDNNLPVVAVGAVLIIILAIQSIINKKGLGAYKTVAFVLSALSFALLFNVVGVITYYLGNPIQTSLTDLLANINSDLTFATIAGLSSYTPAAAITSIYYLFHPATLVEYLTSGSIGMGDKVMFIAVLVAVVFVSLNFIIDLIGLSVGKKYNEDGEIVYARGAKVFSLIRHLIVLAAAVTTIVTLLVIKVNVGVYLYVLAVIALIEVIISIVRVCKAGSAKKKNETASPLRIEDPGLTDAKVEETNIVSTQPEVVSAMEETEEEEIDEVEEAEEEIDTEEEIEEAEIDTEEEIDEAEEIIEDEIEEAEIDTEEEIDEAEEIIEEEIEEETVEEVEESAKASEEEVEEAEEIIEEEIEEETVEEAEETVDETEDELTAEESAPSVPTITTVTEEIVEDEQLSIPVGGESKQTEEVPVRKVIYNVQTVYSGPTDAFMDTLTNDEKVEFTKVFIRKAKGDLPAELPDYEIGGNNDDFFPVIFIYLGKFRTMLSRGLLSKIYRHLNNNRK
ncbi:MAG: hypothetical protein ACI4MH_07495 [Candidatus Coproplasma sp.]